MSTPDEPDKHLEGKGHAHHQFNPERAEEFHDPERLKDLRLADLMEKLGVSESGRVLDLGTGSGALLPFLSKHLQRGVVIGADVNDKMLARARDHISKLDRRNVVLLRNGPGSLPNVENTVDVILIVSSLHEFSDPIPMLWAVNRVLKPGGRLGILEWRYEETPEGPPLDHRLKPDTIRGWLDTTEFEGISIQSWTQGGYDLYLARTPSD